MVSVKYSDENPILGGLGAGERLFEFDWEDEGPALIRGGL